MPIPNFIEFDVLYHMSVFCTHCECALNAFADIRHRSIIVRSECVRHIVNLASARKIKRLREIKKNKIAKHEKRIQWINLHL